MLAEITSLDAGAIVAFLAIWLGYEWLFDSRHRRPTSINAKLIMVREAWMLRLLGRDNRIVDATLIGYSIRTATFFASTTILLVAGLIGVLGAAERVHGTVSSFSVLFQGSSQTLFELKVLLLLALLVYAFFKFTWAIRQFNYFAAVVGSAPEPKSGQFDRAFAGRMAQLLSQAMWQVNAGIRAYYFAFATIGWFVHPLVFVAMCALMASVMVHRQMYSTTARAIADHVDDLALAEVAGGDSRATANPHR